MLPNFIGIGAARAGSTWLWRNLSKHPDIFVPKEKEIHFFDKHFDKGTDYYEQFFNDWEGERLIGEVTPRYLHWHSAPERIYDLVPKARLICCLRNPIDRAYSHYWHTIGKDSSINNSSFEERIVASPEIVPAGLYFDHLKRYLEFFPLQQMHVFVYEQIAEDADQLLRAIYRFLTVDEGFVSPLAHHRINSAASTGSVGRSKFLWHASRVFKRLNAHVVEKRIESLNHRDLPPMNPETSETLRQIYRQQVVKLEELLDLDLSVWGIA